MPAAAVFVSTTGDDQGHGSRQQPFATLHRAQRAARELSAGADGDVVVNLRAGVHRLERPLTFSVADSGPPGHRVIYQPYGWGSAAPEPVVLSGGRLVTGWRQEGRLWWAEVGDLTTRQLYVDGRRAWRARLAGGAAVGLPGEVTATDDGYLTTSDTPLSWENPADIELVYLGHAGFAQPRCRVAAIEPHAGGSRITMAQPGYRWFRRNHTGRWGDGPTGVGQVVDFEPPSPLWVENCANFLTEPGTFYLDRSQPGRHVLHYLPRPGEDPAHAEVAAPVLEQLVAGAGEPGSPVRDLTFRGLTFAEATWLGPDAPSGFSHVFGPIYEGGETPGTDDPWDSSAQARSMPGAVRFHRAERIVVEDCHFRRLGADAVEFSRGSSANVVRANVFTDVSGGAVSIGTRYPEPDGDPCNRDNVVEHNLVYGIGVEYQGSVGIYLEQTQHAVVAHNRVEHVPYTGIAFGEYWTHYPEGQTTAYGNRIVGNHICAAMRTMSDGGGIFCAAHQGTSYEDGSIVQGNLIHDLGPDDPGASYPDDEAYVTGLYPDDDTNWVTWQENVVYRIAGPPAMGCPVHTRFLGNFLAGAAGPEIWCSRGAAGVVVEDTTVLEVAGDPAAQCASIPAAARIVAEAGPPPELLATLATGHTHPPDR